MPVRQREKKPGGVPTKTNIDNLLGGTAAEFFGLKQHL